jgi:hypothetical protein
MRFSVLLSTVIFTAAGLSGCRSESTSTSSLADETGYFGPHMVSCPEMLIGKISENGTICTRVDYWTTKWLNFRSGVNYSCRVSPGKIDFITDSAGRQSISMTDATGQEVLTSDIEVQMRYATIFESLYEIHYKTKDGSRNWINLYKREDFSSPFHMTVGDSETEYPCRQTAEFPIEGYYYQLALDQQ